MKKLILIVLVCKSFTIDAQTKYTITLNSSENRKTYLDQLTAGILSFDRFLLEQNKITFSTFSPLKDDEIRSKLGEGQVIAIERNRTINQWMPEKAGGTNCPQAQMICSNTALTANSSGFGTQELNSSNSGCLYQENQSSWYYINVQTAGILKFRINPNNSNNDYDFAVWGPFTSANASANCPPATAPIRCNYSADNGNTGLSSSGNSNSQDQYGSKWSNPMNVLANQVYILLIDNYSTTNQGYNLQFSWGSETSTAVLGCLTVVLPIELIGFQGTTANRHNTLTWSTASEMNNDYFTIEQSDDGIEWKNIAEVNGAGSSTNINHYEFSHFNFNNILNYYRLSQTDFDGTKRVFSTISIDNSLESKEIVSITDLLGQEVATNYTGLRIIRFSDGSTIKKMGAY